MNNVPCVNTIEEIWYQNEQDKKNAKGEQIEQYKYGHIDSFKDGVMSVDDRDEVIDQWFEGSGDAYSLMNAVVSAGSGPERYSAQKAMNENIIKVCDSYFQLLAENEYESERKERGL